jgi:hypothetical protein
VKGENLLLGVFYRRNMLVTVISNQCE